jgi:predicted O-methyltransferase YrrM
MFTARARDRHGLPGVESDSVAVVAGTVDTRSTSQERWSAVDRYIVDHLLLGEDPALEAALRDSVAAGLPPIAVTPAQGKLLELLARVQGARTILELGTLGGYSTLWLARALPPGGRLVTLEANPRYAALARANIARAGYEDIVELRVGPALETLPELAAEGAGPFDLIFIDADKGNYPGYFEWSLKLSRPGTLIVGDNVVRDGAILDPDADDPSGGNETIKGVRRFYEMLAAGVGEGSISATAIQTVGDKGYDGFALAIVGT